MPNARPCLPVYNTKLDAAFCGCVKKRCRWFKQRLRPTIVSTLHDVAIQIAGEVTADEKLLNEAAELFDVEVSYCYERHKDLLPARLRFVVDVGKYGEAETTVSGAAASVRKCVQDAFSDVSETGNWISEDFLKHREVRFSGVVQVQMAWKP